MFYIYCVCPVFLLLFFYFSSRSRHTICALVTGVQTCALPIFHERVLRDVPDVRARWRTTDAKREIALMLSGVRKQAGLSQKQVAERTGWDKSFVSRLEGASGGVPDTETIARYVAACGATVGMVIGRQADDHLHVIRAVTLRDTQGDPMSEPERKGVGKGKSGSGRVELGGRQSIKKKN